MKKIFILVIGLLLLLVGYTMATAYYYDSPGNEAVTKDNIIAAVNPDILRDALEYEKNGESEKLQQMLKNGQIIRLKGGTHVKILEHLRGGYRARIQLANGRTYWVEDKALTPIK